MHLATGAGRCRAIACLRAGFAGLLAGRHGEGTPLSDTEMATFQ